MYNAYLSLKYYCNIGSSGEVLIFAQEQSKNGCEFQISIIVDKCHSSSHIEKIFLKIIF